MSLLDKASLIVTPNGYSENTIYSVIPSSGAGDLTFTRATDAWRTNSQGLVQRTPWNLLQYSQTFNNAAWVNTNTTLSVNSAIAPNGTLTATNLVATSSNLQHSIQQNVAISQLGDLTFSCYVKNNGGNFVQLVVGAIGFVNTNPYQNFNLQTGTLAGGSIPTSTITSVGDGWYRITINATNNTTGTGSFFIIPILNGTTGRAVPFVGDGVNGVYIWGAQLVEGSSALEYFPTTDRQDVPRIDYSLGGCPTLLMEPQRTNVILRSEEFDNAAWSKLNSTITANSTISPNGILTADTITDNSTNSIHVCGSDGGGIGIYTFSFYAKANTLTRVGLLTAVSVNTTLGSNAQVFDLLNGTVVNTLSGITATITNVGNGWYRCSTTLTALSSGTYFITCINTGTNISYIGTGSSLFLWGAQLEAGSYPTSYIPTTTASVTRNSESFSRSNVYTNNFITAAGGTWFVNLRDNILITRDGVESGIYIDSLSGGFTNGINIRNATAASRVSISKWVAGAGTPLYTTTADNVKLAIKWNGATADIFENGVKVVSATSFAVTNMEFLQALGNASARKFISSIMLFPTPLSDSELELLTGDSFDSYAKMAAYFNYTLQ